MSTGGGALIVGSEQAALQAASDLADSGIPVTIIEESPFLKGKSIRQMLHLVKHPNITFMSNARVKAIRRNRDNLIVEIARKARYVDIETCTGCGDCMTVCPMPLLTETSEHRAIFKPARAVPDVVAIEKEGTAPCRNACPIDQRAQGYIALIRERRFAEAYHTIKQENPFPSVCGRVCNHRCEQACNREKVDSAVNIMALKRFVADWAANHPQDIDRFRPRKIIASKGKKVAIVGAGPAGLTCANDLVSLGYQATVFEAQPVAGGMMRLGVPDYRLPPQVLQREIDEILQAGVELKLNHRIDDMGALLEQGFDAVFIAVGAHIGVELPIHGRDLPDVHLATDFLRSANLGQPEDVFGKQVLVIGGGNVGLDVAQVAIRTGASRVGMACLESRDQMPAFDWEIRDAEEEGVHVLPNRTFKEITGSSYVDGEWITGVRCAEVNFRGFVNGRPDMDEIPGTETIIPADVVVFAVGQWPDLTGVPDELEKFRGRWLVADERTQVTNLPGVTAGGDVVTGTRFIVDAIAAGHKAAHALDTYLTTGTPAGWQAANPNQVVVEYSPEQARARLLGSGARYAADIARHEVTKLPAAQRKRGFFEMYRGLNEEEAVAEARRCLVCGACSECLACVRVCQADAIDHYDAADEFAHEVGAILWEGDPSSDRIIHELFSDRLREKERTGLYHIPADLSQTSAITARAMKDLARFRKPTVSPLGVFQGDRDSTRIGVFICRCGDRIDRELDVDALVKASLGLPDVVIAQALHFSCHPESAIKLKNQAKEYRLDRLVLAACACCSLDQICSSCTYQRLRCKQNLLGLSFQPAGFMAEFVNIREQCAWAHRNDPDKAMDKAKRLIAASVARVRTQRTRVRATVELGNRVLIAGEGEAALICANALRGQNIAVAQCTALPVAISGSLGNFTVTLRDSDNWIWDIDTSLVVLAPDDNDEIIGLMTRPGVLTCCPEDDAEMEAYSMVTRIAATLRAGRFLADHNIAFIDPTRCLGCGTCEQACEYGAIGLKPVRGLPPTDPSRALMSMMVETRSEEPRQIAQVRPVLCRGCGTCAALCPSNAISAGYSSDEQIEAMLEALLM